MESKTDSSNRFKCTENNLLALAQHLNDGILAEDSQRRILLANQRFSEIFPVDLGAKDYVGARGYELFILLRSHFPNDQAVLSRLEQMTLLRTLVLSEEMNLSDGRCLEVDFIPFGENEDDSGHIYVIRDITRVKANQLLIERQKAMIAENSRIVALGEMAAGVAHEINNPLAIIHAKISLILRDVDAGVLDIEKTKEYALQIKNTSHRISKIVKGLRNISRDGENDPMEEVSVKEVIEETLAFCFERFRNADVELRTLLPAEPLRIHCKSVQISQVILNLLNNAFDAIEEGDERWIELSVFQSEKGVVIQVMDAGGGVPEEIVGRIFQPFFTSKEKNKGTGLGLSISKMLVEKNGGELNYVQGASHTTFQVILPIAKPSH